MGAPGRSSFGTLLGPEATGPYFFRATRRGWGPGWSLLFLRRPVAITADPFCGVFRRVVVPGVTGLLFENYIVDASIL